MFVFALDTATRRGSLAFRNAAGAASTFGLDERTHGERLPVEATAWLQSQDHTLAEVDLFAVTTGPGSFTGLRVGLATVQGWAMATARRVVPVSTFEALAWLWRDAYGDGPADPEVLVIGLDGQRGDLFCAAYGLEAIGGSSDPDVLAPVVGKPDVVLAQAREAAGRRRIACTGDGVHRFAEVVSRVLPAGRVDPVSAPPAEAAAAIAFGAPDRAVAPHALRPLYVRRPDAEIARDQARDRSLSAATVTLARTPADLSDVEALQRETFTRAWGVEAIQWELEHTDVARLYVMRGPDGTLIGYCACWVVFDELHINSLAVAPAWRRRGAARRLLARVFDDVVRAGARSATLEVRRSNEAALKLYEGLGFRVEGTRRDYYQEPREDALILWHRRLHER